jgi:predicted PurR-regulated permease PerM
MPDNPASMAGQSTGAGTRHDRGSMWSDGLGRAAIRAAQTLLVLALAWVILWTVTRVPLVIIPVVIALILASAIAPLVRWLAGHGWPRALAVLTSFVAILAVFGGIVTGVVALVRIQWKELASRALAGVDQLHAFLNNGPIPVSDQEISAARGSVQKFFSSGSFGADALTGLRTGGEILAGMVLMAVILFFFLKTARRSGDSSSASSPVTIKKNPAGATELSTGVLGGYVRGTAIMAAIDALIRAIALLILQVPLAVPLAVFVFIGGFIPIIGATRPEPSPSGAPCSPTGPAQPSSCLSS